MTILAKAMVPDATDIHTEDDMALVREGSFARLEVTSPGDFFFEVTPPLQSVAKGNPATFGATLRVAGGFSSPVFLEIIGLPDGIVPYISKNPVLPDEQVAVTIPTDLLQANVAIDLGWRGTEVV